MRFDRIIELHEPGPQIQDDDGSVSRGPATVHTEWAHRRAQSGYTRLAIDTLVTEFPVQYTIRAEGLEDMDSSWWIVDEGKEYKIESFYEPGFGRDQFLVIVCVERK